MKARIGINLITFYVENQALQLEFFFGTAFSLL